MSHSQHRDDRWAKQFGDFAENLTMYLLGHFKNMSVALIDHVGADVIATKRDAPDMRYAVSVKGRNIPIDESKSFVFSGDNIKKLTDTANNFGMIPAVSFVFVDEMEGEKKIRALFATLDALMRLRDDSEADFINNASDGFSIRYTEGKNKHHLTEIKQCDKITYMELIFSNFDNKDVFL